MSSYAYFVMFGIVQLIHSQEEIWTDFHKKWFVFKMPRWFFVTFESVLSLTILFYILKPSLLPIQVVLPMFALAMLVNGVGHIVWGLVERKYVPGLITAPLFLAIFVMYFINLAKA